MKKIFFYLIFFSILALPSLSKAELWCINVPTFKNEKEALSIELKNSNDLYALQLEIKQAINKFKSERAKDYATFLIEFSLWDSSEGKFIDTDNAWFNISLMIGADMQLHSIATFDHLLFGLMHNCNSKPEKAAAFIKVCSINKIFNK